MISIHPYEGTYFNWPVEKALPVPQLFDLDYWGLSYRPALEYILRLDSNERIPVMVGGRTGEWSAYLLSPAERERLRFTENPEEARYFITTKSVSSIPLPAEFETTPKIHSIKIKNIVLAEIYRLGE